MPGRFQEFLRRAHQVLGPRADPLGVAQQHERPGRKHIHKEFHAVDEYRCEGFHPIDDEPLGHTVEDFGGLRMRRCQRPGARTDLWGEQEFARRMQCDSAHMLARPLIGYGEVADLLDRVAPELDTDRMLGGRGEDIEDAPAHGELAASLDEIDAGVSAQDELGHHLIDVDLLALLEDQRLEVGEAADKRLEHRSHGRADHPQGIAGLRMGKPAQDGDTATRGVSRRAQPLVRQCLPRREDDRAAGTELVLYGIGDVLGLASSRRHDEHTTLLGHLPGDRSDKCGSHLRDSRDVDAIHAADSTVNGLGDARDAAECPREARERHSPDARSIPARSCSAKSGSPTRKSVT